MLQHRFCLPPKKIEAPQHRYNIDTTSSQHHLAKCFGNIFILCICLCFLRGMGGETLFSFDGLLLAPSFAGGLPVIPRASQTSPRPSQIRSRASQISPRPSQTSPSDQRASQISPDQARSAFRRDASQISPQSKPG